MKRGAKVLIPLLVDVPLWVVPFTIKAQYINVLIPLLVDVPLWDIQDMSHLNASNSLNPSFSGCPALGLENTGLILKNVS